VGGEGAELFRASDSTTLNASPRSRSTRVNFDISRELHDCRAFSLFDSISQNSLGPGRVDRLYSDPKIFSAPVANRKHAYQADHHPGIQEVSL
jgi:hypothetical protein